MTEKKEALHSDLARVDRHVIQPAEYEEIPEVSDADMARGLVLNALPNVKIMKTRVTTPKKGHAVPG